VPDAAQPTTRRPHAGAPGVEVEVATWRPVEVVELDGWRLGFSGGFTSRGNSVVAAREPSDVDGSIELTERAYRDRGMRALFRVDTDVRPVDLEARLDARGYRQVATTHVLSAVIDDVRREASWAGTSPEVADLPDDDWLNGWLTVKTAAPVDRGLARALIAGSPAVYLTSRDADGVTGVIRAGFAEDWVGLSCLMVAPRARRRGLGAGLTRVAVDVAAARGARRVFLQVEAANRSAATLYSALGFRIAQTYHYRERDSAS
jgi:N-acetylglutamate synthase